MIRDRLSSCHSTTLLLPAAVAVTTTSFGAVVAVVTTEGYDQHSAEARFGTDHHRVAYEYVDNLIAGVFSRTSLLRSGFGRGVLLRSECGTNLPYRRSAKA